MEGWAGRDQSDDQGTSGLGWWKRISSHSTLAQDGDYNWGRGMKWKRSEEGLCIDEDNRGGWCLELKRRWRERSKGKRRNLDKILGQGSVQLERMAGPEIDRDEVS